MKKIDFKSILRLWPDGVLFSVLLGLLFLISLVCFCNIYPEGDVMEHIKASFKVYNGKIPYKDFFEHHHPLLWYMMGWFVALFEGMGDVVVYVVDYVTFLFFLIGVYYIYRIMNEFICGRTGALLSVLFILCPGIMLYYIYYKPDNFMFTCISAGLFYFFLYLREHKRFDLVVSYFLFWLAFMFLQKAVLFYPVLGAVSLYMLCKKEIAYKDFLLSIIAPIVLSGLFVLWIFHLGIWDVYWKSNFAFNSSMRVYMGEFAINKPWFLAKIFFGIGLFSVVCLFVYMNKYFRILSLFFVFNLAVNLFYISPYVYYYYLSYCFAVCVAVAGILKIAETNKLLKIIVVLQSLIYIGCIAYYVAYDVRVGYIKQSKPYSKKERLETSINMCDFVYFPSKYLYNKDLGYYWFLLGHVDVFAEKVGLKPVENINELIESKKPKIIFVKDIYDRYEKLKGNKVLVHEFDMDMIERFYDKVEFENIFNEIMHLEAISAKQKEIGSIYLLKQEYWKTNCKYNIKNKEWEYEEN